MPPFALATSVRTNAPMPVCECPYICLPPSGGLLDCGTRFVVNRPRVFIPGRRESLAASLDCVPPPEGCPESMLARTCAQTASVSGSSSIDVAEGENGFGRRGSRTNESGGGSSMKKSPQRPSVRSSRRKRSRRWSQRSRHPATRRKRSAALREQHRAA